MAVGKQDARSEADLRQLAYRDSLTQLPNRLAMADRIEDALARAAKEGTGAGLLFVDIDDFKRVNDTLGHAAGDELLIQIARRLERVDTHRITAGRHGGDEFLLLIDELPHDGGTASDAVAEIADEVAAALRPPFTVARCSFEVTASAGASIFPRDAATHHELLEHADQAMYIAKRGGRARTVHFERREPHSLIELETTLRARRALEADEFELFYQPVIEIADGRGLGGLEALLRWHDPDRGLLCPESFLPYLEHSPLLEEIGEWVLTTVCRQLAEWTGRGFSPQISFNLPARQLKRPGFAEFMADTAREFNVDPSRLAVEITETSPVSMDEVLPILYRLRDTGFALSLDDFGTGYSSLARLRSMPFSLLKTDRTFMSGIPGDHIASELLEGIVTLGRTLGLTVIVEGVESMDQERELLRLGARMAQGYYLGAPASADAVEAAWAAQPPLPTGRA
jgi:diguanylate cyclase